MVTPAQLEALRRDLDELHDRTRASLGAEDIAWIESIMAWSRRLELVGRGLLHVSLDPATWSAGVVALWLHKQLETMEMAHNILHGTYDQIPGGEHISKRFKLKLPVWEEGWKRAHNLHHAFTNIVGRDPDARFGTTRLNETVPRRWFHRYQLAEVVINWTNVMMTLNLHVCGLVDFYMRKPGDEDLLRDRSLKGVLVAHKHAVGAALPYLFREYVLYPALAGPGFLKVAAGNYLSSMIRDVMMGVSIYMGHTAAEATSYPKAYRPGDRAQWYAMQIATTKNYDVSLPVSVLIGGVDCQIEHHLFPKIPPRRLRAMSREVKAICERHGIPYHEEPGGQRLRSMLRRIVDLGRPATGAARTARAA